MAKHDWNSFTDYLSIHEKTIRFYHKFMEIPKVYIHKNITDYEYQLDCIGIFLYTYRGTRLRVDIRKVIEVDPSNPRRPKARTFKYTYSANIAGGQRLFRYCSPHRDDEEEGKAPHHSYHHKHDYTKNPKGEVILIGSDEWPHVGEFFEEVLSRF